MCTAHNSENTACIPQISPVEDITNCSQYSFLLNLDWTQNPSQHSIQAAPTDRLQLLCKIKLFFFLPSLF